MRAVLVLPLLFVACSSEPEGPTCPPGETMRNGSCVVRLDDCGDHAVTIRGGGCKDVGVVDCGKGFASDGAGGCTAVLPEGPCGDGTYALPGDAACHGVPCDEPDGAGALHVDGKAADGGDGSSGKPYRTFTAALAAASSGARIVVAPGAYDENLAITKAVQIFGRCGGEVLVRGRDATRPTLQVTAAAELHQLAVTGPYVGVLAGNVAGVVLDRLWFHDIGRNPIYLLDEGPGAEITVRDVFIERSKGSAVIVSSANATIERLAVRATSPHSTVPTTSGYALHLRHQDVSGKPREKGANVTLTGAHFESTTVAGVVNESSELRIEGMYLHDTRSTSGGDTGYGIISGTSKTVLPRSARIELVSSVIERVISNGAMIQGGSARFDGCTIRSVAPTAKGLRGFGIVGAADPTLAEKIPAELEIVRSTVRDTHVAGILFFAGKGSVRDSIARGVQPLVSSGLFGDAISLTDSDVVVEATLGLEATRAALSVFGGTATLKDNTLRCSPVLLNSESSTRDATGMIVTSEVTLHDEGGNSCGCTADLGICRAQSTGLEPLEAR